ncbi:MAG: GGDEF domain-containing protein [Saccharofermentans sp.]|nr:GGDEF domain-containing protein [Saccharofermentans sp.]
MNSRFLYKHMIGYFNDQSIDIRIRMMYFLEYTSFIACFIGTICMILLKQTIASMVPNFILFVMSFISLYISHVKKNYELSTTIMIIGCANLAVPWMYFTAGGINSGMIIWFIFSVVVACLMSNGRMRVLMVILTVVEDMLCMIVEHNYPKSVTQLVGENAAFYDVIQSFTVVCVCLTAMLIIYISTYDNQRRKLETILQTDALTGVFNRRAYYDEMNLYTDSTKAGDLVLVAMDVNGLKKINDQLGHAAGDDYIRAAAAVITDAVGQYGHIFRTGGDEFTALLHCSVEDSRGFEEKLSKCIAQSNNPLTEKMAIAVGIVCCEENPNVAMEEIEKMADKKMYENKAAYYKNNGIDRRR